MTILVNCSFHSEGSPCDQVGIGDVKPLLKSIGASGRGVVIVSEEDLVLNRVLRCNS